ncbi:MAG: hypothetical protein ACI9EF_003192 [Pseudohongiellaceae bacterium]|jgi:hypothetical protein
MAPSLPRLLMTASLAVALTLAASLPLACAAPAADHEHCSPWLEAVLVFDG